MQIVVADTSPLNYLVLIGKVDLFPLLFERIIIPREVYSELTSPHAPLPIQEWIEQRASWLEVQETPYCESGTAVEANIDRGERAAITLALHLQADLVLMDDRKGAIAAERSGLAVTGTLGILDLAAERGFIDFRDAVRLLECTNFRRPTKLLDALLDKHR